MPDILRAYLNEQTTAQVANPLKPSEGEMLAEKLLAGNISNIEKLYTGVAHNFFGMASVIPKAKQAQAQSASQLKNTLE